MESERKNTSDTNKAIQKEQETYKDFFVFLQQYKEAYKKIKEKIPYHINVIDELYADENAHSRILAKLLQQKTPHNRYEIFESFIEYIKTECKLDSFGNISIEKPVITQETERIDLWIRDKEYAIIIENKIHYAVDQEKQLERYIKKTLDEGFNIKNIFVIYLSPRGEDPSDQSWGKYKEELKERYLNLSFEVDILKWLNEKVLPNLKLKDVFLRSAIEQYIDHLNGIFGLREENKIINMELKNFIKKEFKLSDNLIEIENINKLLNKRKEIDKLNNQISSLINEITYELDKSFFEKSKIDLYKKYPDLKLVYEECKRVGFIVPIEDSTFVRISISIDRTVNNLYCQIDMQIDGVNNQPLPDSIINKVKDLLPKKFKNNEIFKYFDRYKYNEVYDCFINVMKKITK